MAVRYILDKNIKHLYLNPHAPYVKVPVTRIKSDDILFCSVLDQTETNFKLRVYEVSGNYIDGWVSKESYFPLKLHNEEELYDGRFNA